MTRAACGSNRLVVWLAVLAASVGLSVRASPASLLRDIINGRSYLGIGVDCTDQGPSPEDDGIACLMTKGADVVAATGVLVWELNGVRVWASNASTGSVVITRRNGTAVGGVGGGWELGALDTRQAHGAPRYVALDSMYAEHGSVASVGVEVPANVARARRVRAMGRPPVRIESLSPTPVVTLDVTVGSAFASEMPSPDEALALAVAVVHRASQIIQSATSADARPVGAPELQLSLNVSTASIADSDAHMPSLAAGPANLTTTTKNASRILADVARFYPPGAPSRVSAYFTWADTGSVGGAAYVGGVCTSSAVLFVNMRGKAINTAALVLVHEVLHVLGVCHDDDSREFSSCAPDSQCLPGFIMGAYLQSPHPSTVSACTFDDLAHNAGSMECLGSAVTTCGNGILEPGEECDAPGNKCCTDTCTTLCESATSVSVTESALIVLIAVAYAGMFLAL